MPRISLEHTRIAGVVFAYFIVSIALVFTNKILMSPTSATAAPVTIPNAPVFVTWFQCFLSAVIILLLGSWADRSRQSETWLNEFPRVHYHLSVARQVLPLSIMFVCMIIFNNLCLENVEVSFYNVARSLTIVANVIFSYYYLGEKTSSTTIGCLLIVIVGFFVGSDGEINFSLKGTLFGVASSCFVSLNAIYTKKLISVVENDKWKLAWYNNVNATFMFLPLIFLTGEHVTIYEHQTLLFSSHYWFLMFIAGVLGFAIGIVTVMQINLTSPLTHNISGTAKACVQTILALFIFRNPTTIQALLGIFLTIFGSMLYAWVRMNENSNPKKLGSIPATTSSSSSNNNATTSSGSSPSSTKNNTSNESETDEGEEEGGDIEMQKMLKK